MVRFIDIGDQYWTSPNPDWNHFAFLNTVNNKFFEFAGEQLWSSWNDFEECYRLDPPLYPDTFPLERFKEKVPEKFINATIHY